MLKKLSTGLILAGAIISSSCTTTETLFAQEPLPIPDRPEWPTIQEEALACLSDDAYRKLVERDAAKTAHMDRLEAIMRTTHNESD